MFYLKGQKHFNDCGVAVSATILGLLGIDYNYKSLGKIDTFLDILLTLEKYKINAKCYKSSMIPDQLSIIQIKKLNRFHFVVIYHKDDNYFYYYSPNKLIIHKIKISKLMKYFTGNIILINTKEKYLNYKIDLLSLPYSIKLIIFDVITIILIYNILNSVL